MIRLMRLWVSGSRRCHLLALLMLGLPLLANAAPAPVASPAVLSPEQRAWLDQRGRLRVGLVLQAPYAQLDKRLQLLSGANVDLMKALEKTLQVELIWRNFPDQAALEAALEQGVVDLAPGLTQTPAGLRLWLFSDPYMRVPNLVVGERNGAGAVDLEKLDTRDRVAVRMPSRWLIICAAPTPISTCRAFHWSVRHCNCY